MQKATYSDMRVIASIGRLVPVRVNMDAHHELAAKYNIQGIPAALFLNPRGGVIGQAIGYRDPEEFLATMGAELQSGFLTGALRT